MARGERFFSTPMRLLQLLGMNRVADEDDDEDFVLRDVVPVAPTAPPGPGPVFNAYGPAPQRLTGANQHANQRLYALLSDLHKTRQLLAKLSGEAALLWRLFAEVGQLLPLPLASEEARLLLGGTLATKAFAELRELDLVLCDKTYGSVLVGLTKETAALALPTLPPLDEPHELAATALPTPVPAQGLRHLPFELALTAVAVWTLRPKRTVAGPLYKKDEERLQALLGKDFPVNQHLSVLMDLMVCGGAESLAVQPAAAERLASVSLVELMRMLAARTFSGPAQRALALLYGAAAQRPGRTWFFRGAIERALRIGHLQGHYYFSSHDGLRQSARHEADQLLAFPGIQVFGQGVDQRARLWPPLLGHKDESDPGSHEDKLYLQPSFELLVPPTATPEVLLTLGKMAELKKFDQVATLSITRASVARATEQGDNIEDLLAFLQKHAAAGVPQNVAMSMRSWAGQSGQARFAQGLVLLLKPEAERLAEADASLKPLLGRRLSPGTYLVAETQRGALEKRLKALDILPSDGTQSLHQARAADLEGGLWRHRQPAAPPPASRDDLLLARTAALREKGRQDAAQTQPGSLTLQTQPAKKQAAKAPPTPPRGPVSKAGPVTSPGSPGPVTSSRSPGPVTSSGSPGPTPPLGPDRPPPGAPPAPAVQAAPRGPAANDDVVPHHLIFQYMTPATQERVLRQAIRLDQPVYIRLADGQGPWKILPQRITHRGKEVCLEGFRPAAQEFRSIPLSIVASMAIDLEAI